MLLSGHGLAEALVLAEASVEVSVEAGAEAAAEADLDFGGRFELASNCRRDGYYAKR
jgi:high-affinity K+ transport system ATPase subunit B